MTLNVHEIPVPAGATPPLSLSDTGGLTRLPAAQVAAAKTCSA